MVLQQTQQVEANQMIFAALPFKNLKAGQLILWRNKLNSEVLFEDPADDIGIVISVNRRCDECSILWLRRPEIKGQQEVFYGEWFDDNEGRLFSVIKPVNL